MNSPSCLTLLAPSQARLRIPHDQLAAFAAESEEGRKSVLDWISALEPMRHIKGREKMFPIVAREIGEQTGTVKKRFYQYLHGVQGKCHPLWEEMIDRAKYPRREDRGLDLRFVEYWKKLREDNKRLNDGGRQAHRDLLSNLRSWELGTGPSIPGYSELPERSSYCNTSKAYVPDGWSYRNLCRHQPRRINLVNVIQGPKAASALLPSNSATRAGIAYRQIIFSDDQDYDNAVVTSLNRGEAMRPQGFNTLDYLTGHFEMWGIQLRRRDEATGIKRGINQEFYVWTILADLMRNGFRDDHRGTTIIREHATAKGYTKLDGYGDSFDDVVNHITGGRVSFDHSGRFDQSMFAQMLFSGTGKQSSGNFRYKAPLESAFHRVRTQSAGLLGDTGNRYQVNPEHNDAIDGYTERLFKAIDKLPVEKRHAVWDLLKHHKHTWGEFTTLMGLVYQAVNHRRDHKLEGWSNCGFILPGYSLADPMRPDAAPQIYTREQFALMAPEQRQYVQTFGRDHLITLTPAEAVALCKHTDNKLVKLGRELAVSALPITWAYGMRNGKTGGLTVKANGTLIVRDPMRFGEDSLTYIATVHTRDGGRDNLRPGESVLLHVCPFDPDEAICLSLDGRYRGFVKLLPTPCASDREARLRNQGMINQYHADVTRDSLRRQQPEIARGEAILAHNDRVLSGEIQPTDDQLHDERFRLANIIADQAHDDGLAAIQPDPEDYSPEAPPITDNSNLFANIFATDPELDNPYL